MICYVRGWINKNAKSETNNMRDFMSANIDEYYLEAIKKYYKASEDRNSKIVDFSSRQASMFLRGSEHIGDGKEDFWIIDQFSGIQPVVFNYKFLVEEQEAAPFIPGIMLDSNVVSCLHRYVTDDSGSFRNTPRGSATRQLISSLATKNWDFNGLSYLLESASKHDFEQVFPYAEALARSILKLQPMNNSIFLETDRIEPDPNKDNEHISRHGIMPLETTSGNHVNFMYSSGIREEVRLHIQVIYATLLNIALLNRRELPRRQKLKLLFQFLQHELGIFPAREAVIACLHFAGKTGKFLSLKKNVQDSRKTILASAWDLFLLRMRELLISNEGNEYTSIYYVCTAEKMLQKLGEMFVIRRISSLPHDAGHLPSSIGFRLDLLSEEVGEQTALDFGNMCDEMLQSSSSRRPANLDQVLPIVSDLEVKASKLVG